jgi:2-polyprenyl-3-methyl-5-hydroxy-6-metoxy-1,4-benzoquinol methylase
MLFSRIDFSQRVHLTEWMDEPCSHEDLRQCLRDLEKVNGLLGGYTPTIEWISRYLETHRDTAQILDVGSGGGGMLRAIERWAHSHDRDLGLTGIDLNPSAVEISRSFSPADTPIRWVAGSVFSYQPPARVDLLISSLLTHHLDEEEIVRFLVWMEATAVGGWFINDLRRSAKSYYSFKALAWIMGWHRFVRHDGPVSVRRAFLPDDWRKMCRAAGLEDDEIRIEGKPFGRLCVSRIKP